MNLKRVVAYSWIAVLLGAPVVGIGALLVFSIEARQAMSSPASAACVISGITAWAFNEIVP